MSSLFLLGYILIAVACPAGPEVSAKQCVTLPTRNTLMNHFPCNVRADTTAERLKSVPLARLGLTGKWTIKVSCEPMFSKEARV